MSGNRAPQRGDDLARLVDRQRRLRDVGEPRPRRELEAADVLDRLDEDGGLGRLAHRPDDLLVTRVADQDDRVAGGGVAPRLHVDLRDERARRVDDVVAQLAGAPVHGRRDPVRGVDDRRPLRHLRLVVDEDRAACLEVADDVRVVDDLLADVDRRPVVGERELDRLDGALDAGAVPARRGEQDARDRGRLHARHRSRVSRRLLTPPVGTLRGRETERAPDRSGGSVRPDALSSAPRGMQGQVRAATVRIAQCHGSYASFERGTMGRAAYLFKRESARPRRMREFSI